MSEARVDEQAHLQRPKLNPKPSWIGRPASHRPDASKMSHKVKIEYRAPGLQPPVYITTSLSEPQWDIHEMKVKHEEDGEYLFHREYEVAEGEYQYKFRLGPGDWWVCDESQPTINDDLGNRNNILYITAADLQPMSSVFKKDSVVDASAAAPYAHHPVNKPAGDEHHRKHYSLDDIDQDDVPLLKHETTFPGQVEDIPEDTVFHSPETSPRDARSADSLWHPVDNNDPTLHHLKSRVGEAAHGQGHAETELRVSPQRSSSGLAASSLPQVQEELESEEIIMVIEAEDDVVEGPAAATKDQQPLTARADTADKQVDIDKAQRPRGMFSDLSEVFFGIVFAVVVAAVALVLYSTGMAQQDVVNDGGAALDG